MICEKEKERKVQKYAEINNYTIIANTLGAIEYVKYDYSEGRSAKFLKWPKGADSVTIMINKKTTKISITELTGN